MHPLAKVDSQRLGEECCGCKQLTDLLTMTAPWLGMVVEWHEKGRHRWVHLQGFREGWMIHDGINYHEIRPQNGKNIGDETPAVIGEVLLADRRYWPRIPKPIRIAMGTA